MRLVRFGAAWFSSRIWTTQQIAIAQNRTSRTRALFLSEFLNLYSFFLRRYLKRMNIRTTEAYYAFEEIPTM